MSSTGADTRASCPFPVVYSVPALAAVAASISDLYAIGTVARCELLHRGINDTYLLMMTMGRWIARVYRGGWRSTEDVAFEVELRSLVVLGRTNTRIAAASTGSVA